MSQHHYKTREVRDLAWACFSPPLFHSAALCTEGAGVGNCALTLTEHRLRWLHTLDEQPESLHKHLKTLHNGRLGLYFESLWHFFLQNDPSVDLIAHNLPVREGGKTVGEFDCLYYCHVRQAYFHLELAVKYYLGLRPATPDRRASQWADWLGPTNTDNLERKITHLFGHQIKLGEHPEAKRALVELGIDSYSSEVEIKGYLFQPLSNRLVPPRGYNIENPFSMWLTVSELDSFITEIAAHNFCLLDKPQWLAPAAAHAHPASLLSPGELTQNMHLHFANNGRPVLVAAFGEMGRECRRFFVTGANWPTDSGKPREPPSPLQASRVKQYD